MTDPKHPLTDEMINEIKSDVFSQAPKLLTPGIEPSVWSSDCMRIAYNLGEIKGADWQLEQVIEWIAKNVDGSYLRDTGDFWQKIEVEDILSDLKKAMRPLHPVREEES